MGQLLVVAPKLRRSPLLLLLLDQPVQIGGWGEIGLK